MAANSLIFQALYLGKCVVLDTDNKQAIKMATRSILGSNGKRQSSFTSPYESFEVDIELKSTSIKVKMSNCNVEPSVHQRDPETIILDAFHQQIASCFVLRENPQIVSLVVMNEDFIADAHVFCMDSPENAQNLMNLLMDAFQIKIGHLVEQSNNNVDISAPNNHDLMSNQQDKKYLINL